MQEYIGKHIGGDKIKAVVLVSPENTEPSIVEVEFENGTKEKFSSEVLKTIATENPVDLTSLRELVVVPLAEKILKIMLADRFKLSYWDYLMMKVKASVDQSADKAQSILWKKAVEDLTVADIDDILLNK